MKKFCLEIILPVFVFFVLFELFANFYPPQILFENQADGFAYYLPLRSFYFDRDFHFSNENWYFEGFYKRLPYDWKHLTLTGHNVYHYSLGPSILWFPFVRLFSADYQTRLVSPFSGILRSPPLGYSQDSLRALVLGTHALGVLSLVFTYLFLKNIFKPKNKLLVWVAVFAAFLATPFYYYFAYQPLMSHALSAFGVSLFLFCWSRKVRQKNRFDWFLVGSSLGLASLIRWSNSVLFFFPIAELISSLTRLKLQIRQIILKIFSLEAGFLILFLPQMIFWKIVYGNFLVFPQGGGFFELKPANLVNFLFSWHHGLFTWTPIVLPAIIGIFCGLKNKKGLVSRAGLLVITVLILVNSFNVNWHGGDSFGARRMTGLVPIFALGLYLFLKRLGKICPLVIVLFLSLVFYNLAFSYQYSRFLFDHDSPVYPVQVLGNLFVDKR